MNTRGAAALAAALILVYAAALNAPVMYDDLSHIRDNPAFLLPAWDFLAGLVSRNYFSFASERTFQPLVTLFHYATHGSPLLYRSFGLAVHLLNVGLLYSIAQHLTAGRRPAIYAAILFCFFPAHTELLNFSAFKGHLFAATCVLAVILSVIREQSSPLKIIIFLAAGLLSKESALVAVPISLLYAVCFRRADLKRLLISASILCALYLLYRFAYLTPPPAFPRRFEYSSLESLAFYLRTLVVPYPLCLERTVPAGPWFAAWLSAFAAASWLLRKSKPSLFTLLWIPLALLPFLHLISFSNVSPVADRYLYLPAAGFSLLLAFNLNERALIAVAVAWTALTGARNQLYLSPRSLYADTASCAPLNPRAHFLHGNACFQEGDFPAARAAYERVLSLTDSPGAREALENTKREEAKVSGR